MHLHVFFSFVFSLRLYSAAYSFYSPRDLRFWMEQMHGNIIICKDNYGERMKSALFVHLNNWFLLATWQTIENECIGFDLISATPTPPTKYIRDKHFECFQHSTEIQLLCWLIDKVVACECSVAVNPTKKRNFYHYAWREKVISCISMFSLWFHLLLFFLLYSCARPTFLPFHFYGGL